MAKDSNIENFKGIEIDILFNDIIEENSKIVAEQVKQKAIEVLSDNASNNYANSWTYRMERDEGVNKFKGVVYNKEHYRLTHLLEFGHDVKNGTNGNAVIGRAAPKQHVEPVFQDNKDVFIKKMSAAKYEIKEK